MQKEKLEILVALMGLAADVIMKAKDSPIARAIRGSGAYKAIYNTPPAYAFRYALSYFLIKNCMKEIAAQIEFSTEEELVDFSAKAGRGIIAPWQKRYEITEFLKFLKQRNIKTFMEIGTASGGTLFLLCRTLPQDAFGLSLDLPGTVFREGYQTYKLPLYRSFARGEQKLEFIRADSHSPQTLERAHALLGGRKLDFLFIDGDHRYVGVKQDFEMYSPLVRRGGIVAFHDITVNSEDGSVEVKKYWEEIKKSHKHLEIINKGPEGSFGIGVLFF